MVRLVTVLVLGGLLLSAQVAAAGQFGPASPQEDGLNLGLGYHYSSADLDQGEATLKQHQLYARLGMGFSESCEIYLRGGTANLEIEDFDDSAALFLGGGVKGLILQRRAFDLGAFVDGSVFGDYEDNGTEVTGLYDLNAGLTLETVIEGARLYAGPVFFIREMDVEAQNGSSDSVEEDGNVGGFVGASWRIKDRYNINVEAQFKTDFSGGIEVIYNY